MVNPTYRSVHIGIILIIGPFPIKTPEISLFLRIPETNRDLL